MAKEIVKKVKLEIEAGKANPAPPVGTVLGPAGINLQDFCTKYIAPAEITIYDDRSFDFVIKTPPTAYLIKKYAKVQKGSVKGRNEIVGSLTEDQVKEIATIKLPDLNANDLEAAIRTVKGTALNMGIEIK